jgi:ligand-binding sensor domain-containing protein/AraC-like DNA-binding protein
MVEFSIRRVEFLSTIFLCLFLLPEVAQAEPVMEDYLVSTRLTRENGLPDPDINGICFDSSGYAWISTFGGGLVRYDGDSFIRFSAKTHPAFFSDFVNLCCEDNFGRLWVPSAGGMNILDLQSLSLVDELPGLSSKWLHTHSPGNASRDANGGMWFASDVYLYRVSFSEDGSSAQVDSLRCNIPNTNLMSSICDVDGDGSVWISQGGHLFKVRHLEGRGLSASAILPGVDIGEDNKTTAFLRSGNDVWIGTLKGLYRVNVTSGKHAVFSHSDSDRHSLPNDEVTGLCFSPEGEVAVGTLGGICIYRSAEQYFDTYTSHPNEYGNSLLPGEMVRSIVTRDRQIWVGLEAEGLAILQGKPLQIINFSHIDSTPSPVPSTPVRSMIIDSKGTLWLATTGYGLCRQVDGLVFRNYSTANSALLDNAITAFCEDGQGRIWMGTVDGHLNYVSLSSPDVIRVPEESKSEAAKSIDVIVGMAYDSVNGYVWISARNGLYIYDPAHSTYTRYPDKNFSCLGLCVSGDVLWVSSMEGLCAIDLKTLTSRTLEGIPYCMALLQDGDTLWAGTYGFGVYRVDHCQSEKPDITVYSEKDGLADGQVQGLLLDGYYLWITTENGLSRLDTQVGELLSFGLGDGLSSMAFCENSVLKGSNGTIYLGQKEGLSVLLSSHVQHESGNKPDVVISGYYAGGSFYNLSRSDAISKDEKDLDFTVKFSDLSYASAADVRYESRILPLSKEWSPVYENDTDVKFGHIPGGKYRIQIRAVDKKGRVLSQDEKILDVKPVLLNRWWFRLLVLLFFGLVIYLFILWYTYSINQKKNLLQQEVDRQTKELKEKKEELERKAEALSEQNALLQKQNEMIASHNTLLSSSLSTKNTDFSSKLLEAIQKRYKDPDLDVQTLAEDMGMTRSVLNDRIQKALGLTTAQFIRTYRLNVAKEMICNGTNKDMNISEIAYEVGFNDPKYFTRCFTKEFSATPSELHAKEKVSPI